MHFFGGGIHFEGVESTLTVFTHALAKNNLQLATFRQVNYTVTSSDGVITYIRDRDIFSTHDIATKS